MVNINAEPKPSYELTEEELDKATGGREGPRAPDQPDRDHQGCGQPIAQTVGARRTSDVAFFFLGPVGIQDSHSSLAVIQAWDGPIRFD